MAFGRKEDELKSQQRALEKAAREQKRAAEKEEKEVARAEKQQERAELKAAQEAKKLERERNELERFGKLVINEVCAGKLVRIYDKGYVRVSGVFFSDQTPFEKLLGISSSADVAKKTALGRTLAAGATMGANLVFSPNKRGDMYLTITTNRDTHMIHMSPPTERDLKAMHKLATAGQAVIEKISAQDDTVVKAHASSGPQSSAVIPPASLVDELTKLAALKDSGAINEEEFASLKSQLMAGGSATSSESEGDTHEQSPTSESGLCDLILVDSGNALIEVIKVVRKFTDLGLKEAKDVVDNAPSILLEGADRDFASQFAQELQDLHATVELR